MDYSDTVEDFLRTLHPDTASEYRHKLRVFHSFMKDTKDMSNANYFYIISRATPDDIVDSIEYYIKNCAVKYKLTVDGYFSAIAKFFDYLHSLRRIDNEMFSKKQNRLELRQLIDDTAKKFKLNAKRIFPPLSDEEVDILVERCNEILSDPDLDKYTFSDNQKYNSDFSDFISAIILKIVILSGVTNDILLSMTTSDVDLKLNKIRLNGYWVHLPDTLSLQLERYFTVRSKIVQDSTNDLLFFSVETSGKTSSSQMMKVLRDTLGHSRAMSVAKHSIIRKLETGMSPELIMAFTGYSGDVVGHCWEEYNERRGVSASKAIDLGIHADRYFDRL